MRAYIIEGPCGMANVFGIYQEGMLPAERFAVVKDGQYANGGSGPISVNGQCYKSKAGAEKALVELENPTEMRV